MSKSICSWWFLLLQTISSFFCVYSSVVQSRFNCLFIIKHRLIKSCLHQRSVPRVVIPCEMDSYEDDEGKKMLSSDLLQSMRQQRSFWRREEPSISIHEAVHLSRCSLEFCCLHSDTLCGFRLKRDRSHLLSMCLPTRRQNLRFSPFHSSARLLLLWRLQPWRGSLLSIHRWRQRTIKFGSSWVVKLWSAGLFRHPPSTQSDRVLGTPKRSLWMDRCLFLRH